MCLWSQNADTELCYRVSCKGIIFTAADTQFLRTKAYDITVLQQLFMLYNGHFSFFT